MLTFAIPALCAPCDSIKAMYLLKSLNSSLEGVKVMILEPVVWAGVSVVILGLFFYT